MSGGAGVHCVVVWEWQCEGLWLPHAPGVARTLERAHGKQLTRVVLADAEPALRGHYVNLRTLTQTADTPEGGSVQCRVRRTCYSVQSPAGRGARWEWARLPSPSASAHTDLHYDPLPMDVQCALEAARAGGAESVSLEGWVVSLPRLRALPGPAPGPGPQGSGPGPGPGRALRRVPQPPYPLTRSQPPAPPAPPAAPTPPARTPVEGRRARIPQQHTGSSVHSVHSAHSAHSLQAPAQAQAHAQGRAGARSASPRERKPGLARQILHNLNIFGNNKPASGCPTETKRQTEWEKERERDSSRSRGEERQTDTECGSTRSGRRHSVDTVSTYLSHESKESLQQGAVGELLNCSAGSDDVFPPPGAGPAPCPEPGPAPAPPPPAPRAARRLEDEQCVADGTIVGVDVASSAVCVWVRAVSRPQWGALCPACMGPLGEDPPHHQHQHHQHQQQQARAPVVALTGCQHMLHLHCLNAQLDALRANGEALYIECLVCGRVYGRRNETQCTIGRGSQPPGSMAWCLQPASLPSHPNAGSILVTYNFQSGRQGPCDPVPGAPYYAVGFPRHTVLPDTPLGREVLGALRGAWERRLLFALSASQTTGRELVVAWRAPPPPPRALYAAGARHRADAALRDALLALRDLAH